MIERPAGTLHFNPVMPGDTVAELAVSINNPDGWVGLGFPTDGLSMVGATAVLATSDAGDGAAGIFDLNARNLASVVESAGARRRLSQTAAAIDNVRRLLLCIALVLAGAARSTASLAALLPAAR